MKRCRVTSSFFTSAAGQISTNIALKFRNEEYVETVFAFNVSNIIR